MSFFLPLCAGPQDEACIFEAVVFSSKRKASGLGALPENMVREH
jgi:hypothetical protein